MPTSPHRGRARAAEAASTPGDLEAENTTTLTKHKNILPRATAGKGLRPHDLSTIPGPMFQKVNLGRFTGEARSAVGEKPPPLDKRAGTAPPTNDHHGGS